MQCNDMLKKYFFMLTKHFHFKACTLKALNSFYGHCAATLNTLARRQIGSDPTCTSTRFLYVKPRISRSHLPMQDLPLPMQRRVQHWKTKTFLFWNLFFFHLINIRFLSLHKIKLLFIFCKILKTKDLLPCKFLCIWNSKCNWTLKHAFHVNMRTFNK